MNRLQFINLALRQLDEHRFKAEEERDLKLAALRRNPRFKQCESDLKKAQISGDQKQIALRKSKFDAVLKELNVAQEDLVPRYFCPICGDTGYVENKMCVCLQREVNKLITRQSNVVNTEFTFDNSTEKDAHNKAIYQTARKICREQTGNLLVLGNTGSGKTYLLTACVNEVLKQNRSVLFTTAYALNATFLEAHLSDHKSNQAILDALTDVDVLAIDDLGTEIAYKNVTAEYLFTVINERIARKKQTFVSSNLSIASLRDRYDERLFSRLVDKNVTVLAQMQGADKRIK